MSLKLKIEFESTNGTTLEMAVEHLRKMLNDYHLPVEGKTYVDETVTDSYWKYNVLERNIDIETPCKYESPSSEINIIPDKFSISCGEKYTVNINVGNETLTLDDSQLRQFMIKLQKFYNVVHNNRTQWIFGNNWVACA